MSEEIFFTGAGFTKAINPNMPIMSELTKIVESQIENESLKVHYASLPQTLTENIEETLTFLSAKLPWKNDVQISLDKSLFIAITQIISKYFTSINKEEIYKTNSFKDFKDLWLYIYLNSIPTITLNYDIYLECLLRSSADYVSFLSNRIIQKIEIPDEDKNYCKLIDIYNVQGHVSYKEKHNLQFVNLYGEIIQHITSRFSENIGIYSGPKVYKLHGSANWFYSPDNNSNQIYCTSHDNSEESNYILELIPYIIPPVMDKTQFYNNNLLKFIWTQACKKLLSAKSLYIIGFSMPTTDLSIKYLFEFLHKNNKDCNVYVINTKESLPIIENRYKNIFGEQVDFKYCCDNSLKLFINDIITPKLFSHFKAY